MSSAKMKGVQLDSFFEKPENDDISTDDTIPVVIKPTAIISKMKNRKVCYLVFKFSSLFHVNSLVVVPFPHGRVEWEQG